MNRKTAYVLILLAIVILVEIPESLARPEYLTDLISVYGDGSCGTCHIRASGGGPRNSYGTLFENHYTTDPVTALKAIGKPPTSTIATPGATSTLTAQVTPASSGSQEETETREEIDNTEDTETPAVTSVTSVTSRGTPAAAGFEFAVSLAGLLACAMLARRHNK